ncbi:MAG: M16 family metallopeptidase, partial [Actinomycetota bacterium]
GGGAPPPRAGAAGTAPTPSGRSRIVRRKTEQAHLVLGTNAPTRTDPDRFAFGIANTALGGGMSSRLFQEVRERRGLAYSVYSHHEMYGDAGLVSAYAGTTPARAQEVVDLIRAEIAVLAAGRLGAEEFARAKTQLRGQLLLSLEHPSSRMSRLGRSEISGGEILTVPQILRRIERTTLDDARSVAARVFSQPLTLTVLGPFAQGAIA